MAVRNKPMGRIPVQVIDELWKNSIDMHIHPGPDPNAERPIDSAQVAALAEKAGMKAVVLKSFFNNTASDAFIIQKNLTPALHGFGSVVIGYTTTGGLQYAAKTIETCAKIGCKVVWFPAMDAEWCQAYFGNTGAGIYILKEDGTLKDEVYDILKVVKQYNMVVCSGHMSYEESTKMFDAAIEMGIEKMVATHPLAELSRFTLEQIQELAAKGVYIEHVYGTTMPRLGNLDPSDYVDCVKLVGADKTIMGTDLAQVWDTDPATGMRLFIGQMIQFGCTPEEVELMCKRNPAKLLDV
ncbi:MAG: hypothetical protein K2O18_18300, partial [Oscillospiraceae bacterium]|nr:hypothetical protein [Oscillospiraceae bacterium]